MYASVSAARLLAINPAAVEIFVAVLVVVVVVVVALSWVKAEPLYPHHNYILG